MAYGQFHGTLENDVDVAGFGALFEDKFILRVGDLFEFLEDGVELAIVEAGKNGDLIEDGHHVIHMGKPPGLFVLCHSQLHRDQDVCHCWISYVRSRASSTHLIPL